MGYIDSVAGSRDGDCLRGGVESICAQLTELGAPIAPSTYYEHHSRPPTIREVRGVPCKGLDDLEIAAAEWVDRYNRRRPFEYCDDLTPIEAEAEAAHCAHSQTPTTLGVSG